MTTEATLGLGRINQIIHESVAAKIMRGEDIEPEDWFNFAHTIEQAVLQSKQVQAWKK